MFGISVESSLNNIASSTRATLSPTFGTTSTREVSVVVGARDYSRLNSLSSGLTSFQTCVATWSVLHANMHTPCRRIQLQWLCDSGSRARTLPDRA